MYTNYSSHTLSDKNPEKIVATLKQLEDAASYPQRKTDLTIISSGQEKGVRTTILMLPMLYGVGLGHFNKHTGQITMLIREAIKDGYVSLVGNGKGLKNYVHIEDAANLYELIASRIIEGKEVPYGDRGILFVESGKQSWNNAAAGIAKAGVRLGQLQTEEVKSLELEEAVEKFDRKNQRFTELAFVSR